MEMCDLNDIKFKISVLKKLNEMQENTDGQFNEFRNKINEQNKYQKYWNLKKN